jgi:hypothetical protein
MSARKKKTILRTIRLSEDVDALLERDSQEQNISTNALVSKIMTRYVEWDRIMERIGYFYVTNLFFRALINEISDAKLEEIVKVFAVKDAKDIAMWATGKTDFDAMLKALSLLGRYSISPPLSAEIKVDNQCTITLHHDWGPKGTVFFRSYFENFVRTELGRQPAISVTSNVITVSFPKLSKPFV